MFCSHTVMTQHPIAHKLCGNNSEVAVRVTEIRYRLSYEEVKTRILFNFRDFEWDHLTLPLAWCRNFLSSLFLFTFHERLLLYYHCSSLHPSLSLLFSSPLLSLLDLSPPFCLTLSSSLTPTLSLPTSFPLPTLSLSVCPFLLSPYLLHKSPHSILFLPLSFYPKGALTSPKQNGSAYVLLHHVMGEAGGKKGVWAYIEGEIYVFLLICY